MLQEWWAFGLAREMLAGLSYLSQLFCFFSRCKLVLKLKETFFFLFFSFIGVITNQKSPLSLTPLQIHNQIMDPLRPSSLHVHSSHFPLLFRKPSNFVICIIFWTFCVLLKAYTLMFLVLRDFLFGCVWLQESGWK